MKMTLKEAIELNREATAPVSVLDKESGMMIEDPTRDVTGRYIVDPVRYYGMGFVRKYVTETMNDHRHVYEDIGAIQQTCIDHAHKTIRKEAPWILGGDE